MAKSKSQAKKSIQVAKKSFHPLYEKFLSTLSSTEREVCEKDLVRAMPTFRKFIEKLSDEELSSIVK